MILNGREINRIVASGCSFTYGHGLDNRAIEAWPARLAERANIESINLGVQAMGNEHVYNSIVDYFSMNPEHKKDSFVVPSYSSYIRVEFYDQFYYKNGTKWARTWPEAWATRPLVNENSRISCPEFNELFYKDMFNEEYYFARYYRTIIALQGVLKSWLIPYVMFDGLNNPHEFYADKKRIQPLKQQIDEKRWIEFSISCFHGMTGIKKLPCGHPTVEAHDEMAEIIYQHIINNYTLEQ
jgi:hypothetical protein